jgi:hypothetical protein
MDAQTQPWFYPINCVVLGRDSESILVPVPDASEALLAIARAKNYAYAGMMTLLPRELQSKAECEPGMERVMMCAVPKFAQYVKETLTARFQATPAPDDSAEWLAKLWIMEDPRKAN